MHQTRSQSTTKTHPTTIYKMTSNNNSNSNSYSNLRTITITAILNYSYHHTYPPNVIKIIIQTNIILKI